MMEYLITMAAFILAVTYFLMRWSDKLIEKLKEIQPPVKAEEKGNSFSYPEGKTPVITTKGHPLGEGVHGHIEGYVTDGGIAYALMMFGNDFYRLPVKDMFEDYPAKAGGCLTPWRRLWHEHCKALTVAEAI